MEEQRLAELRDLSSTLLGLTSAALRLVIRRTICDASTLVSMARTERKKPAELAPAPWPDVESPSPAGEAARQFTRKLRNAIGGASLRSAAASAGINHATLLKILAGQTWPDLETIAKLETGLKADLWPGRFDR